MSSFRVSVLAIAGEDEAKNRRLISLLERQKLGHESVQWVLVDPIQRKDAAQTSPSFAAAFSHVAKPADGISPVVRITAQDGCDSVLSGYNRGLSKVEGEYTLILHAGDEFSADTIRSMLRFADKVNPPSEIEKTAAQSQKERKMVSKDTDKAGTKLVRAKVPIIAPRHVFDDGVDRVPDRFDGGADVKGVDLRAAHLTSLRFPLTLAGTMILTEALKSLTQRDILKPKAKESAGTNPAPFDERLSRRDAEADALLRLLLRYGLCLSVGNVTYVYRTPQEAHFATCPDVYDRAWYLDSLERWLYSLLQQVRRDRGEIPAFLQAAALFFVRCRLEANRNNRNRRVIEGDDLDRFWKLVRRTLAEIDDEVIDRVINGTEPDDFSEKVFLLQLKHNRLAPVHLSVQGDHLLLAVGEKPFASHLQTPVSIQSIDYKDGGLEIDGTVANVYDDKVAALQARIGGQTFRPTYCERFALTKYFGQSAFKQRAFHIRLPLSDDAVQSFSFELLYENRAYPLSMRFDTHFSRLTTVLPHASWRFEGHVAQYHAPTGSVIIRKNRPLSGIGRELLVWCDLLRTRDKRALAMLLMRMGYWLAHPFMRRRHIWFFMDKIYKGGDNAEYLYRYVAKQKDGVLSKYLIDRTAPDAARLRADGYRPLYRGTFAHYTNLLHAEFLIASNSTVLELNHISPTTSAYIRDLIGFHVVCVQHGLSVQRIAAAQNRLRDNTRLYFCASPVEIENLSRPIYDYEGYDSLRLTGVPRFDGLQNRAKKQILLSPTWRMQAAVTVRKNEGVQRDYNPFFKETAYYKVYNDLIHHPRLLEAAKEYGYTIAYVLHPIVSPQARDFEATPPVTVIPATGDMSYETLFCESALMVTDYSGVQFDFAYMRKPLLYYLPDTLPKHYEEGAFITETMGFGEVCRDAETLVDHLIDAMKTGCVMPEKFRQRADRFFAFDDHENCKRIYEELRKYQKEHF